MMDEGEAAAALAERSTDAGQRKAIDAVQTAPGPQAETPFGRDASQESCAAAVAAPELRLSVALCTYNGAAYLPAQLETMLQQTVLPFEVVVCDDRSTDGTVALLEAFAARAPFPVRVQVNAETLRPAQNFARCVGLCTGDVIVLSDQDDLWLPERLQRTREAFGDPAVMLTYADAPLIDADGQPLGRTIYSSLPVRAEDAAVLERGGDLLPVLMRASVLCGATMAFRASLLPLVLPVPPLWAHDEWIGTVANAMGRAVRLLAPVMQYRQHTGQQLGTGDWTVGTHLRVARSRQANFFEGEERRLREGLNAARRRSALARLLPLLEDRHRFAADRLQIYTGGVRTLPVSLRLLFSHRYSRYASGGRSWVKDMAAMLRHTLSGGGARAHNAPRSS